jgi:hypothetical protein
MRRGRFALRCDLVGVKEECRAPKQERTLAAAESEILRELLKASIRAPHPQRPADRARVQGVPGCGCSHRPAAPAQTIQGSNYTYKGTVTREGQDAVCALKCAVFGADNLTRNVLELVAFHSITRVGSRLTDPPPPPPHLPNSCWRRLCPGTWPACWPPR